MYGARLAARACVQCCRAASPYSQPGHTASQPRLWCSCAAPCGSPRQRPCPHGWGPASRRPAPRAPAWQSTRCWYCRSSGEFHLHSAAQRTAGRAGGGTARCRRSARWQRGKQGRQGVSSNRIGKHEGQRQTGECQRATHPERTALCSGLTTSLSLQVMAAGRQCSRCCKHAGMPRTALALRALCKQQAKGEGVVCAVGGLAQQRTSC